MTQTLEQLRADLALAISRFHTGTATGGSATTIVDANSLPARFNADDQLINALAYIRTDAGAGAAPQGEARLVSDYVRSSGTITLAHTLTAAVAPGDVYELYLAPLPLEAWDAAINAAIDAAWPQLFATGTYDRPFTSTDYALPAEAMGVDAVFIRQDPDWPWQPLAARAWWCTGTPGANLRLHTTQPLEPDGNQVIRATYRLRYPRITTAGQTTDIDPAYLLAAARAEIYARLADAAGSAIDRSAHLQLMAHWSKLAQDHKKGRSSDD